MPMERTPGTLWIGFWVCSRASQDVVAKRKVFTPNWELNPDFPVVQPVA
jgi:hypothetical protein